MAVQVSAPFNEIAAPVQSVPSASQVNDSGAAGGTGSGETGRFEGYLRAAKTIRGAVSEKGGPALKKMADGVSDEDLSRLIPPLIKGLEQIKIIADNMASELEQGNVDKALAVVSDAAAKVSRFNPDLILAEMDKGLEDTPLIGAIKEFLGNAEGEAAPGQGENIDAESQPAVITTDGDDSQSAGAAENPSQDLNTDSSGTDSTEADTPENPAAEQPGAIKISSLYIEGMQLNPTRKSEGDTLAQGETKSQAKPAEDSDSIDAASRNLRFLSQLGAHSPNNSDSTADGSESELPAESEDPLLAAFKDVFAKRTDKDRDGSARERNSSDSDSGRQQLSGRLAKSRSAAEPHRTVESDVSKPPVTGDFASMLRERSDGVRDIRTAQTPTPGATYALNQERAFGDGLTSVLQFMRSDGTQEARIVVQPPALGRIDISLQSTSAGVEAVFKVDNEQLKQVLQQQIETLKASLQAQGIHVSGLAVDIKNRDDRGRGDAGANGRKLRRVGAADEIDGAGEELPEGASLARLDLEKGLLHWLA